MTTLNPQVLNPEEIDQAGAAAQCLVRLPKTAATDLRVEGHTLPIPSPLRDLMIEMLTILARGEEVIVLSQKAELTTQQVADLLNVSRPYVVNLIDHHQLPARTIGSHRRVLLVDALAYKQRDDQKRAKILDELTREAQQINPDY